MLSLGSNLRFVLFKMGRECDRMEEIWKRMVGMAMNDEESYLEDLKATYVETRGRVKRMKEEKECSAGCIVKGGKGDKYYYWQRRVEGRQVYEYIQPEEISNVETRIEILKIKEKRVRELTHFIKTLEKVLKAVGLESKAVIEDFEKRQQDRKNEAVSRRAAQKVASEKKYAENYKHITDRGEQVASKSELIIANVLYGLGVKYEYEREITIDGVTYKPDFTIWRPDGSIVLWEHAGLMDDASYAWDFQQKLRRYQAAGFRQGLNLIVTADDNGAFSAVEARRMVEVYRLV